MTVLRKVIANNQICLAAFKSLRCQPLGSRSVRTFSANTASSSEPSSSSKNINDPNQDAPSFDFRVSRLGLAPKWITPYMEMLLQLPEIQHAADALAGKGKVSSMLDSELERASQVMEGMQRGGNEHLAVLALRAELQQRLGNHQAVYKIMCQIESFWSERIEKEPRQEYSPASIEFTLAKAKCLWYLGEFDEAFECCDDLLETDELQELPLHYASALTGSGLAKLLTCETLDDAFTVRDPFRMAVKCLEMYSNQLGPALIAANLNLGVAEIIYGNVVREKRDVEVPIDPALKTWTTAITLLERRSSKPSEQSMISALDVRLQANMAWGIIKIDDDMDDIVPRALEFAGKALKASDGIETIDNNDKEYFRRVLTIVAKAYHKAGKAVTAEGLLQSATTLPSIGCTLTKLDESSAFRAYSGLCKDWEKRQRDAERLETQAKEIESQKLPANWQGKNEIHSSLWFWTPSEFFY